MMLANLERPVLPEPRVVDADGAETPFTRGEVAAKVWSNGSGPMDTPSERDSRGCR
jgi:hypothetical protein